MTQEQVEEAQRRWAAVQKLQEEADALGRKVAAEQQDLREKMDALQKEMDKRHASNTENKA